MTEFSMAEPSRFIRIFRTKLGLIVITPFLAVILVVAAILMCLYLPLAMLFGYFPESVE